MHAHQGQQRKVSDCVNGAADKIEQLNIDAMISRLVFNSSSKGGPEGVNWCTSPDRERNERDSKTCNKYGCAKEDAPKVDDRKDAVQKKYSDRSISSATVYRTASGEAKKTYVHRKLNSDHSQYEGQRKGPYDFKDGVNRRSGQDFDMLSKAYMCRCFIPDQRKPDVAVSP